MPLFLCKLLLSSLFPPHAFVVSLLLTRFCNQVFRNVCKTLRFCSDTVPGRWERRWDFPTSCSKKACALKLLVILWFCVLHPCRHQDSGRFGANICPSASSLPLAVPLVCVTHFWLDYVYFRNRSHSSALWQLCRDTQLWKECCSLAESTSTSVNVSYCPL